MIVPALPLPKTREEISGIQSRRKIVAVENARKAPFFKGKLDHIDTSRLDDPMEWRKIPILDKDQLRAIPPEQFMSVFCIANKGEIAEFWRSGGTTGRPLFYPRTFEDIRLALAAFARTLQIAGCRRGEVAHLSMPLGTHPAGHMWARSASSEGVGINWVGSGAATPSRTQIQLLDEMRPEIWIGMASYALHLANLANADGIDLAAGSVGKILCSAEPLSAAKREKIERAWNAEVFDTFGMTECAMMAGESAHHDGFHVWTDVAIIEVLDPETWEPVPEGEQGNLVITPLWTNHATPFLRWSSGDVVTYCERGATSGPFAVFPIIKHAHRTTGFFKIRGVNINHAEFEEFMFRNTVVADFKVELVNEGDLDLLLLSLEVASTDDVGTAARCVADQVKEIFGVTPQLKVLPRGAIAEEFEASVKPPRFVDRRQPVGA